MTTKLAEIEARQTGPVTEPLTRDINVVARWLAQTNADCVTLIAMVKDLTKERIDNRERVADFMHAHSYATGHGDTIGDLLGELHWQETERWERLTKERDVAIAEAEAFLAELSCLRANQLPPGCVAVCEECEKKYRDVNEVCPLYDFPPENRKRCPLRDSHG